MKKVLFLSFALLSVMLDGTVFAAPAARGGRATAGRTTGGAAATTSVPKTMSARAATGAKTAPKTGETAVTAGKTAGRTTGVRGGTSASTGVSAPKTPTVSARAATTQKVVGTGTKVSGAAKNIVVSEECQAKYEGCMDAFCMIDNDSGGRCVCSDKNAELDAIFAEIEKLDEQSYQMATFGVEKLEMGTAADDVIAAANAAANSLNKKEDAEGAKKKARKALDLSMWDAAADLEEEEDVFAGSSSSMDSLDGKEGDALHKAAAALCKAQIPECAKDINMLQLMYGQKIKSDCTAYENVLKQKKTQSSQKLQAAERALRETALEQYQNANKYDLGQCTIKFKECMQTTAGCGNDFSKCATTSAMDATNTKKSTSKKTKNYFIQGAATTIEISASTYDALIAKKPLCESVTKQCTKVAGQVWDTFLKEVAPQLKSAEIIAEDNARQDCIGNISSCFQKACKDTIDPKDPDGSYDMCLSRPEAMLNVCKIPLNNCGISAVSAAEAKKSIVWDFVTARLAAMRVDACTEEVKACLQSENACGEGYGQCVGLDLKSIKDMCPLDKLVACQSKDENGNYSTSWENIDNMIYGIMLNIDNSMLEQCKKIVNDKVIEICGSLDTCTAFADDPYMGTDSLMSYSDKDGDYVIEGLISFGNVRITEPDTDDGEEGEDKTTKSNNKNVQLGRYKVDIGDYESHLQNASDPTVARVIDAIRGVENKISQKISLLTQDEMVRRCVDGRDMSQITGSQVRGAARYPHLLDSYILNIMSAGLDHANNNYKKKYEELLAKGLEEKDDAVKSVLCTAMASDTEPQCTEYSANSDGTAICTKYSANTLGDVFAGTNKQGLISGQDTYATKYVIAGAKIEDLAKVQQKGHSEYTMIDNDGNMMGKVAMNAIYSADKNTCTFTTTTTMCKETEAVISTNTYDSMTQKSGGLFGGGGCNGSGGLFTSSSCKKTHIVTQTYNGSPCKEFGEPQTTTQNIKM